MTINDKLPSSTKDEVSERVINEFDNWITFLRWTWRKYLTQWKIAVKSH